MTIKQIFLKKFTVCFDLKISITNDYHCAKCHVLLTISYSGAIDVNTCRGIFGNNFCDNCNSCSTKTIPKQITCFAAQTTPNRGQFYLSWYDR